MISHSPHRDEPVVQRGAPLAEARGAVVLLHGRGASAADILGLAPALTAPGVAFLAPEAAGHAWYPNSFLARRNLNEPWISSALGKVGEVVKSAHAAGVPYERIVICGFSQGACLSTEFVASHPRRYGALIAFTGGLIGPPGTEFEFSGDLAGMPAVLSSGDPDPHVPWARVLESAAVLRGMGAEVTTKRYPGKPHSIFPEELKLAANLVASVFA